MESSSCQPIVNSGKANQDNDDDNDKPQRTNITLDMLSPAQQLLALRSALEQLRVELRRPLVSSSFVVSVADIGKIAMRCDHVMLKFSIFILKNQHLRYQIKTNNNNTIRHHVCVCARARVCVFCIA